MSRVWTQSLDVSKLVTRSQIIIEKARNIDTSDIALPWIDEDEETTKFVDFWFGSRQKDDLRKLAYFITNGHDSINRALQVAISRLIITKKVGASLAWDVSHSRPHRVKSENDYDVLAGFESAVSLIADRIRQVPTNSNATIKIGNARRLSRISNGLADLVITSPPYLNAIDYIRGHRLALVWLGYRMSKLRRIRSSAVGSEKGLTERKFSHIGLENSVLPQGLDEVAQSLLRKYVFDIVKVMQEIHRIVKPDGRIVLAIASSNIHGQKVDNPALIGSIAQFVGLSVVKCVEREIAPNRRYLPPPRNGVPRVTPKTNEN